MQKRLFRVGKFHFLMEHKWWNPETSTELAWYYASSVNYLFANAIHDVKVKTLHWVTKDNEPVLDYSGGSGTNVLYLASKGIRCIYFGIAQMERAFAEYRFRKRGLLGGLVTISHPWSIETGWSFDPINAALPQDGSLGGILAYDVLEHIPEYHKVVKAMVDSLRIGGIIIEQSPFARTECKTCVHLSRGGTSMADAMGYRMEHNADKSFRGSGNLWVKIKE
eukprot:GHVN01018662.1.p1 GENE.GHVN01018662.1~~GHVN01018662.1.p1  ORF type:complete len:222 (+),score=20.09 GHVN01018662.1:374-1039(+)